MDDAPEQDEPEDDGSRDAGASDETVNLADARSVKRQHQKAKLREQQIEDFWRKVMADPIGRMVLWDLIAKQCHAFEDRFACGPSGFPQSEATWFHAGEKAVGVRLYQTVMKFDVEGVLLMHMEHDPAQTKLKPRRSKANAPD